MDYILLILGALLSWIPLLIKEYIELRKAKESHDLALKKEFIQRKFAVFEKATAFYSIAHLSVTSLAIHFKNMIKENVEFEQHVIDGMLTHLQQTLQDIHKKTEEVALSLPLYTDIELTDHDEEFQERFLELLGEIGAISNELQFLNNTRYTDLNASQRNAFDMQWIIHTRNMEDKIIQLQALSNEIKVKYKNITASLRNDLKKYDD